MEKKDACEALFKKLEDMQASRTLDETAIPIIKNAVDENMAKEQYWLSSEEMPTQTAFVMYHASRNTRIILEKMRERFIRAVELHENPKVVDDAIAVFPELQELCVFTDSLEKTPEITASLLEFVRKRVRSLRNTAEKAHMYPSIEEEMKKVDKNAFKEQLSAVADDLRLNLV